MVSPAVRRRYGIVVGLEFALLGVGNVGLSSIGFEVWIPVWVCVGVGAHFFPLSRVFEEWSLAVLGALMSVVGLTALGVGLSSDVASSTVTGVGAGLSLLAFAVMSLIDADRFVADPAGSR